MVSLPDQCGGDVGSGAAARRPGDGHRTAPRSGIITSHRDLIAWQRSYAFGLALYQATTGFPDHERFGLSSQLRRAAVSVASNIAEGRARDSTLDFIRFLRMSLGGLAEIDTQIRFAGDLGYLTAGQCGKLVLEASDCGKLINAMIHSLRRKLQEDRESARTRRKSPRRSADVSPPDRPSLSPCPPDP